MNDKSRIKVSYEELRHPKVDQVLAELQERKKVAAVQVNVGARDTRSRVLKRLLFLVLAGFLCLFLVLSILYFGKPSRSGKPSPQEKKISVSPKSPRDKKLQRI